MSTTRKKKKKGPAGPTEFKRGAQYVYKAEKRISLEEHEIIHGPPELKVIWDKGQRFMNHIRRRIRRLNMAKKMATKMMYWEEFLEGNYDLRTRISPGVKPTKQQIEICLRNRAKRKAIKRRGLNRLRESIYGFLPPSESLSTIPT